MVIYADIHVEEKHSITSITAKTRAWAYIVEVCVHIHLRVGNQLPRSSTAFSVSVLYLMRAN